MKRLYSLLKNPIFIFALLLLFLTIIIIYKTGFSFPDYYTNRELADKLAQAVSRDEVQQIIKHLINPNYKIDNFLYQSWGWFLTIFLFVIIFRIKNFSDFKNLRVYNNKIFVYSWINLSYIVFSVFIIISNMIDLMKYVYHWSADSFSIPLFIMLSVVVFSAIIYYPLVNILSYITYNTKIKRLFYQIIWGIGFAIISLLMIVTTCSKFTYINIILDFYYLVWLIFIVYSINYIKNK